VSKEIVTHRSTRYHFANKNNFNQAFLTIKEINTQITLIAFITSKEQVNIALTSKLRKEGKITTPKAPFKASTKQEVDGLTRQKVFNFI